MCAGTFGNDVMRGRSRGHGRCVGVKSATSWCRQADCRARLVSDVIKKYFEDEVRSFSPDLGLVSKGLLASLPSNASVASRQSLVLSSQDPSGKQGLEGDLSTTEDISLAKCRTAINADPLWNCRMPGSVSCF